MSTAVLTRITSAKPAAANAQKQSPSTDTNTLRCTCGNESRGGCEVSFGGVTTVLCDMCSDRFTVLEGERARLSAAMAVLCRQDVRKHILDYMDERVVDQLQLRNVRDIDRAILLAASMQDGIQYTALRDGKFVE